MKLKVGLVKNRNKRRGLGRNAVDRKFAQEMAWSRVTKTTTVIIRTFRELN